MKPKEFHDHYEQAVGGSVYVHGFELGRNMHGEYEGFYTNGDIAIEGFYHEGDQHGAFYLYDQTYGSADKEFFVKGEYVRDFPFLKPLEKAPEEPPEKPPKKRLPPFNNRIEALEMQ